MKLMSFMSNIARIFATLGSVLIFISGPFYFYETISYGLSNAWHFRYVSGWGFRFVATLEIVILGLIMTAPFWLFVRNDAPIKFLPNRKPMKRIVLLGLLLFFLAAVIETLLQKNFP